MRHTCEQPNGDAQEQAASHSCPMPRYRSGFEVAAGKLPQLRGGMRPLNAAAARVAPCVGESCAALGCALSPEAFRHVAARSLSAALPGRDGCSGGRDPLLERFEAEAHGAASRIGGAAAAAGDEDEEQQLLRAHAHVIARAKSVPYESALATLVERQRSRSQRAAARGAQLAAAAAAELPGTPCARLPSAAPLSSMAGGGSGAGGSDEGLGEEHLECRGHAVADVHEARLNEWLSQSLSLTIMAVCDNGASAGGGGERAVATAETSGALHRSGGGSGPPRAAVCPQVAEYADEWDSQQAQQEQLLLLSPCEADGRIGGLTHDAAAGMPTRPLDAPSSAVRTGVRRHPSHDARLVHMSAPGDERGTMAALPAAMATTVVDGLVCCQSPTLPCCRRDLTAGHERSWSGGRCGRLLRLASTCESPMAHTCVGSPAHSQVACI
uniref:Uncharacterized protein n=2 Tax=Chlamydomonas euryale TaxID=1486919 RepID=A0A7R9Z7H5_9CHLO|mmetsp:Transcript_8588/g.26070  ORF Transcript_8588/g.26070 Transcript_8588/m.26070 type:complete len:440 (+) Transcript_8588:418-1737(+)